MNYLKKAFCLFLLATSPALATQGQQNATPQSGNGGGYSGPDTRPVSIPVRADRGVRLDAVLRAYDMCFAYGDSQRGIVSLMQRLGAQMGVRHDNARNRATRSTPAGPRAGSFSSSAYSYRNNHSCRRYVANHYYFDSCSAYNRGDLSKFSLGSPIEQRSPGAGIISFKGIGINTYLGSEADAMGQYSIDDELVFGPSPFISDARNNYGNNESRLRLATSNVNIGLTLKQPVPLPTIRYENVEAPSFYDQYGRAQYGPIRLLGISIQTHQGYDQNVNFRNASYPNSPDLAWTINLREFVSCLQSEIQNTANN